MKRIYNPSFSISFPLSKLFSWIWTKVIFMTESDVFGIYESMILFCSIGTRIKLLKDLINSHSHVGGKKTPISSIRSSLN